jgi:serine protease Do
MKKEALILLLTFIFAFMSLRSCSGAVSPEKLYKKVKNKVVLVHVLNKKGGNICSGEFVDREGLVVTCAHCIQESAKKIFVKAPDGRVSPGYLIAIDKVSDLALLDTEFTHTPYFTFGPEVVIGQQVYSLGSPLGMKDSMSVGWVENYSEVIYVVHSAFVNPGSSGGPLIDNKGRLVGVNEAILMLNPFQAAQGLFIAVSGKEVTKFVWGGL